MTVYDFYRNLT